MKLKLTRDEKRTMEKEFRANGVPKHLLAMITAISTKHHQAALDRRRGFIAQLWAKVAA